MTLMWLRPLSICVWEMQIMETQSLWVFGSQPVSLNNVLDVTLHLLALQVRLKDAWDKQ